LWPGEATLAISSGVYRDATDYLKFLRPLFDKFLQ